MTLPTLADIAIMILIIHAMIACLVPVALGAVLVKGMIEANRKVREVMPTVQGYSQQMATGARDVSDRIAAPVIAVEARYARARGIWKRTAAPFRRGPRPDPEPPSN